MTVWKTFSFFTSSSHAFFLREFRVKSEPMAFTPRSKNDVT